MAHDLKRLVHQVLQWMAFSYLLPSRIRVFLHQLRGVDFKDPRRVWLGDYVILDSMEPSRIHIGKDVWITSGSKLYIHEFRIGSGPSRRSEMIIEDRVFIGANTVIVKGLKVGKGSTIGAGSIVTKDVPPHSLVGGVPARVIKRLPEKDLRKGSAQQ